MTFPELVGDSCTLPWTHGVHQLLGSAEDNANDTIFVEHTEDETAWNDVAMRSLQMLLGDEPDAEVRAWFFQRGVSF